MSVLELVPAALVLALEVGTAGVLVGAWLERRARRARRARR